MKIFLYNATVQTLTTCLHIINAGRSTRRWFETDEVIAPLLILIAQIVFLIAALAIKHAVLGVVKFVLLAQMGFEFYAEQTIDDVTDVVEDAIFDGKLRLLPAAPTTNPEADALVDWAVGRWPQLA